MNQVCMSCMAISMSLSVSRVIDANIDDAYLLPAWPACAAIINWRPLPPRHRAAIRCRLRASSFLFWPSLFCATTGTTGKYVRSIGTLFSTAVCGACRVTAPPRRNQYILYVWAFLGTDGNRAIGISATSGATAKRTCVVIWRNFFANSLNSADKGVTFTLSIESERTF